jgi:hypothetical protein
MSAYKGQRGPNVSQYIANLNQLSPQQDLLADPAPVEDFSDFLNGEFFDADSARNASIDFAATSDFGLNFESEQTQPLKTDREFPRNSSTSVDATMDFNLNGKQLPIPKAVPLPCRLGYCQSRLVPVKGRTLRPITRCRGACKPRHV